MSEDRNHLPWCEMPQETFIDTGLERSGPAFSAMDTTSTDSHHTDTIFTGVGLPIKTRILPGALSLQFMS